MDNEKKKTRHSKGKSDAKEKKKRLRDLFRFRRNHKRKEYDKLKAAIENISSSPNIIQSWSGKSDVVNESFVLDTVQVGENSHTSQASVAAAAKNNKGNKWKHSQAKPEAQGKKKWLRGLFKFRRHRKWNNHDEFKSSGGKISSSIDTIQRSSVKSRVVSDSFVLDTVQVSGNSLHTSKTSVVTAVNTDNGKLRHSKVKQVAQEKKKRRAFFKFLRYRKRKVYELKSAGENISLSTGIQSLSVRSDVVSDAFVLDTVKVAGNRLHTSVTFVAAAADSVSGSSSTNDEDECMSVVSCANSDETQTATPRHLDTPCIHCIHSQHEILELSNKVAQLSIEKEQQTLSAIYLHQECREMAKEKQLLIEQHKEEIQQITHAEGSTTEKLGKLNAEVSTLKEVNASLMSKVLWTEDEMLMLKAQCSDLKSENIKLHRNMTILML